ncbi:MAG: hypothetical protein Q9187_009032, partial [Circinaria calcarea]
YIKTTAPAAIPNYTGPTGFGGAIDATVNANGKNIFIGVKFYPDPYSPIVCADACKATTKLNRKNAVNGMYDACNFFNSYVLSKNNVPQGLYCSFYTEAVDKSYSTNFGQTSGSDYYSVSQSYGYTLTIQNSGVVVKDDNGDEQGDESNTKTKTTSTAISTSTNDSTKTKTTSTSTSDNNSTKSKTTSTTMTTSTMMTTSTRATTSDNDKSKTTSTTMITSTRATTSIKPTGTSKSNDQGDDNNEQ